MVKGFEVEDGVRLGFDELDALEVLLPSASAGVC